jgi:signal transduction histidine kinase
VTRDVLLTVAAGLLVLTYLLIESRGPDQARLTRVHGALQTLQLHDAELNRDVLLVRSGLLPHYDSLASIGEQLTHDLNVIRAEGRVLGGRTAQLIDTDTGALADAVAQKQRLIEYLKSDNAVLRNSIAYFAQSMRARGESRANGPSAGEAAAFSHLVMRFVGSPSADVAREAGAALARVGLASRHIHDLKSMAAHGRIIIELQPQLDALLGEIVAAPTAARAETLQRTILQDATRTEARAQRFRLVLYLVALILLGYVVFQVARLRARTRELRRQEMQLIQANKMTSLGTLVSGVAHEVNNPNQFVLMNAGVLASAWEDIVGHLDSYRRDGHEFSIGGLPYDEMRRTIPSLIRQIRDGALRIDRIILDLKDFARPGARVSKPFGLNDVVHHALRLLTHLIRRRTDRFDVQLATDVPQVMGDPQQVEQVIVNLIINALESLPGRAGAVTVKTAYEESTNTAILEVQDEGVGIPPEILPRLGEPFFTTKADSGGTGLGLAIASSLVRLHHGRLRFVSEPGRGTRAIVELPGLPRAAEPAVAPDENLSLIS